MESKGRVEGEIGVLFENMDRDFRREGSNKAGESLGLVEEIIVGEESVLGEGIRGEEDVAGREGKCSKVKGGGPSWIGCK